MYGVNDRTMQKRLLLESKLTYKRAVELAQELEATDRDIKLLQPKRESESATSAVGLNRVMVKTAGSATRSCFRCGSSGHVTTTCKFPRDVVCHGCGKVGHIKRACRSSVSSSVKKPSNRSSSRPVHHIQQDTNENSEEVEVIFQVKSNANSPIIVQVKVEDVLVAMEVDTGASLSIVSEKVFRELWPRRSLAPTKVRLCNYNKEPIPMVGGCNVNIHYKGQTANVPLLVVKGSGPSLLGRNWLGHIRLD